MTLIAQPFGDIITYSRAGGATRVNAAGLLVGVDFSNTSLAVGTGSKAFTLTADADVNRDWPVGSAVIAVAQAGATGTMTGVVASYVPSTQVLTITVASVTGSGTGTAWRIGSLEKRIDYDPVTLQPKGLLVEGAATNLLTFSDDFSNGSWVKTAGAITTSAVVSSSGNFYQEFTANNDAASTPRSLHKTLAVISTNYLSIEVKYKNVQYIAITGRFVNGFGVVFDIVNGTVGASLNGAIGEIEPLANGGYRLKVFLTGVNASFDDFALFLFNGNGFTAAEFNVLGDGVKGVYVAASQFTTTPHSSYIPTTTAQVTRAADLVAVDGVNLDQAINSAEGTLYVEATAINGSASAVTYASLNDGTANEQISIGRNATSAKGLVIDGGVSQADLTAGTWSNGTTAKIALAYALNDIATSINGAAVVTDTGATLPTADRLTIGYLLAATGYANAHIKRVGYRPERITNANIQGVTDGSVDFFQTGSLT